MSPKRLILGFLPILALIILVIIFFSKTLTGEEFFVTPDFGKSDILNYEYPTKFFFAESLKHGKLPLWNPQIATGYPQQATITGNYNPINLILFYFLPSPQAFNLGLAMAFLTAGIFTFLYCRALRLSAVASLFTAISFSFSGIFVTQIVHFNVIQTLSFFILELYLIEIYIQKKKSFILPLLAFAVGFQILAGFYQVVLYSLIVLFLYIFWRLLFLDEKASRKVVLFLTLSLVIITGFVIAAIQLLPSWELTKISDRQGGVGIEEIKRFPYPLKHLATFIWPYLLGDPRIGTYPQFSENWGIFWENTGFVGILPLIFSLIAVVWGLRRNRPIQFFLLLLVISLFLMLGNNSPTFFLFKFPPLSLFRVPARWIIFFTFSLVILAGFGFEIFRQRFEAKITSSVLKTLVYLLILVVATVNIFLFAYPYHLREKTEKWLSAPQTVQFLEKDQSSYRIVSYFNGTVWNEQFLKNGWKGAQEKYLPFREALDPNWNGVWRIESVNSYSPVNFRRAALIDMIYQQNVALKNNSEAIVGETARKLLDIQNVKYIISPFSVKGRDLELVFESQTSPEYFIYQNKSFLPRVFIAKDTLPVKTIGELPRILSSSKFDPKTTVILEKSLEKHSFETNNSTATITRYDNQDIEIKAQMDGEGILVLGDSYYPGWKAIVDGKEQEILPANINQRALILEKGEHTVKFAFQPKSFKIGVIISLFSTIFLLILFFFFLFIKPQKP